MAWNLSILTWCTFVKLPVLSRYREINFASKVILPRVTDPPLERTTDISTLLFGLDGASSSQIVQKLKHEQIAVHERDMHTFLDLSSAYENGIGRKGSSDSC